MQERAQALLLSNEQTALQQLDALLATSQTNLMAQRDRFAGLSDAIGRTVGATLVVLLRADSSQSQTVQSAVVTVDNVPATPRTYSGWRVARSRAAPWTRSIARRSSRAITRSRSR